MAIIPYQISLIRTHFMAADWPSRLGARRGAPNPRWGQAAPPKAAILCPLRVVAGCLRFRHYKLGTVYQFSRLQGPVAIHIPAIEDWAEPEFGPN